MSCHFTVFAVEVSFSTLLRIRVFKRIQFRAFWYCAISTELQSTYRPVPISHVKKCMLTNKIFVPIRISAILNLTLEVSGQEQIL